jgi:hypothetical protein
MTTAAAIAASPTSILPHRVVLLALGAGYQQAKDGPMQGSRMGGIRRRLYRL